MDTIFDSTVLPREDRFRAWQEKVCEIYVNVETTTDDPLNYYGRVRAAQFGAITLTEDMGSSAISSRRRSHLCRLDKDCIYIHFVTEGVVNIAQSGTTFRSHPGVGSVLNASEPFDFAVPDSFRSFIFHVPRDRLVERSRSRQVPEAGAVFPTGSGMGRIAVEFCHQLALEGCGLDEVTRASLGEQALDILALALNGSHAEVSDNSIQQARLRSIKMFIESNLDSPTLSPAKIASSNNVSLSYLHRLFKGSGHSVFEWVWQRRLERCYEMISAAQHRHRSITEIAESMGFSNSSHFSNMFRKKYGIRPSDLRRPDLSSASENASRERPQRT